MALTQIASATYSGGWGGFYIYYDIVGQNTDGNYSTINVSLYCSSTNGSYSYDNATYSLWVNGVNYRGNAFFNPNQWTCLMSVPVIVYHNAYGVGSFNVEATHVTNVAMGSATCGANGVSLPPIVRNAVLTSVSFTDDTSNPVFNFTNATGSNLRFWLQYKNSLGEEICIDRQDIPGTSPYTLSLATSERNGIRAACPNSTSITVRCGIYTGTGATTKGPSYIDKTISIVQSNPSWSTQPSLTDSNSTTVALTGSSAKAILGYSNITVTIPVATAQKGGSIVSYKIKPSGRFDTILTATNSTQTKTYTKADFSSVDITAVDSRGWATTVTKTITVAASDYFTPTINTFTALRNATTNTTMNISASGTWYNSTFGGTPKNSLTHKWYYKQSSSSSWNARTTGTLTTTNGSNSWTFSFDSAGYQTTKAYDFKLELTDGLNTVTKIYNATIVQPMFKAYKDANEIDHLVLPTATVQVENSSGTKTLMDSYFAKIGSSNTFSSTNTFSGNVTFNGTATLNKGVRQVTVPATEGVYDVVAYAESLSSAGVYPFATDGSTSLDSIPKDLSSGTDSSYQYSSGIIHKRTSKYMTIVLFSYARDKVAVKRKYNNTWYDWEEYKAGGIDKIWTNGSTSSTFSSQTVTPANLGNYQFIIIAQLEFKDSNTEMPMLFCSVPTGSTTITNKNPWYVDGMTLKREITVKATTVQFAAGVKNGSADNTVLIPNKIYGVRGVS